MSDDNTKTPVEVGQVWDTISDGRIRVIKGNGLGQWEVELVNAPGKGGVMTERHFTRLIKLPPLTPAEIAELRWLEAAATKGPWWHELFRDKDKRENTLLIKYKWDDVPTWICELSNHNDAMQNANLIAALRNFAPRLLAAAEREGRYLRIKKAAREMIRECEHQEDGETVFHRPSHGQMARLSAALAETEVQS